MRINLPDTWTPEDLQALSDALYAPDDSRLKPDAWDDYGLNVRAGLLRMHLRILANRNDAERNAHVSRRDSV